MKKAKPGPEMKGEYDFSEGSRGKYALRYAEGTNIVVPGPDVANVFKDSNSVNSLLRGISGLVGKGKPRLVK